MEFEEVIKNRRSIRKYKAQEIPNRVIEKLIDAARLAPTGMNAQPWKFIAVKDKVKLKKIRELYTTGREKLKIYAQDTSFIENTAIIFVLSSKEFPWAKNDCFLAIENVILAATNNQLGSLCLGALMIEEPELRILLKIPENYDLVMPIAIGYPDETPEVPEKKDVNDLLSYEEFR